MPRFLITFPSDAMDHIPPHELPEVARAAHACCQELVEAGVFVMAGGLEDEPADVVEADGSRRAGGRPSAVSGITVVDVPTREEALRWAAKLAAACRCPQEVRALMPDSELDAMLSAARSG